MAARAILVVEDNPITRKMVRFALQVEGYRVLEAANGTTALELARRGLPDLVIQDLVLPDTDGLTLLRRLRELPGGERLPVLVVTGMVSRLEELRAEVDPHTELLPKPVQPSRLVEAVESRLRRRAAPQAEGRRVLVVDDEPLNRKLAALRLRDAGFAVEVAGAGEEALSLARASPPDAILSDVLMPGMDGFLLCRAVRQDPGLAGLPVVLLSSSYVDEEDRRLAQEMGANALVARTPDLGAAADALADSLAARGAPPAVSETAALHELHAERMRAQVERQAARYEALLRQGAIQAAALSVVRSLAAAAAQPWDLPGVLSDVLVHCLDASGLSTGLLYLVADGKLRLHGQSGLSSAVQEQAGRCFGHPEDLWRVLEAGEPVAFSTATAAVPDPAMAELAQSLGQTSGLIIPFVVAGRPLGVLLLASEVQDLSEPAWLGFAWTLAAQFGQTIAVGQSLSRGAESETRYQSLMEHAHDAILLLDPDYTIREANRQAAALLGRPRQEIVGRRYQDFVVPEQRRDVEARRAELISRGTIRVGGRLLAPSPGGAVPVDVSASVVPLGDQTLVLFIIRDVTERVRAEAELKSIKERLQHVVSSSPAVLYSLRVRGEDVAPEWVSANIERVIGYDPAEIREQQWWVERLHPDDRDRILAQVGQLLATGSIAREYRFRIRDGSYRWVRDEQRLLRDESGEAVEVVGSWWDVTDRKQAELRLEQSEEQYRLLFDDNPHPMWVYAVDDLAFLAVNDAAVRVYGYSRDEFLGMTLADVHRAEDVPSLLAWLRSLPPPGRARDTSWKHRRKDGSLLEAEVASNPIWFRGRGARLVLASDVTEKKRLEAQLLQAQKMEAIGQLAGGVAHDFNNLLGVILGYTELLLKDLGEPHPGLRRAQQIRQAAERAAALTRQLLAFSRKQVLEPRVLDLNAVVTRVEGMLRRVIGEDVQLVTALAPRLGPVRADPGQVEQVLLNLAVNARDAMPRGGKLVLETRDVLLDEVYPLARDGVEPGPHVLLAVSDTGHGMDAATLGRIFEPFFTTKAEGKGTGLGLSTVFGIVKQSGGHVEVYSELERGTAFKIYLPRAEAPAPAAAAAPVPEPAAGGRETVLLVEDAAALGMMIREILETAGYSVVHAEDPRQALAAAAAHPGPIQLVLTDVVMPGMSGRELAAAVTAARPGTRVLYMSGYPDEAIVQQGALLPGTQFIQKPFTADALLRRVREVLNGGAADR